MRRAKQAGLTLMIAPTEKLKSSTVDPFTVVTSISFDGLFTLIQHHPVPTILFSAAMAPTDPRPSSQRASISRGSSRHLISPLWTFPAIRKAIRDKLLACSFSASPFSLYCCQPGIDFVWRARVGEEKEVGAKAIAVFCTKAGGCWW